MQTLTTSIQTSSADVVRDIHAAGHRIVLIERGPIRWTYHTSASEGACLATLTAHHEGGSVSPIPGGTPGYRG